MTQDLHERIDDLVAEVPAYVVPDARAAWAAGARRRTRRRVAVVGAGAVVVALLLSLVAWLPGAGELEPADGGAGDDRYPARVTNPWREQDLPTEPGPLAMVYSRSGFEWWVAGPTGDTWRVPQGEVADSYPPALSPGGQRLGYAVGSETYVVRNLVDGTEDSFTGAGSGGWFLASQAPGFWSPDGSRLLLRAGGSVDAVVLDPESTFHGIAHDGNPTGWIDDDTLAFLVKVKGDLQLQLVDAGGRTLPSVSLDLPRGAASDSSQWTGSVSPDGQRLAVTTEDGGTRVLSTSDGRLLEQDGLGPDPFCGWSWRGDRPAWVANGDLVTGGSRALETLTVFDPDLDAYCALAAPDALAGTADDAVFGTSDSWISWHVRQVAIAAGILGTLLGGATLLLVRRRRRAQPPTS